MRYSTFVGALADNVAMCNAGGSESPVDGFSVTETGEMDGKKYLVEGASWGFLLEFRAPGEGEKDGYWEDKSAYD